jgi:DNA sulfur modification protein DndB
LQALGSAGAELISQKPKTWKKQLKHLGEIDWSRANTEVWEGRALMYGKLSKARANVALTSNLIKIHLGVPLSAESKKLEEQFNQ